MYDVILLGTGIASGMLGAILARHGVRTILVEKGTHPRFAVGESTVPETTLKFDVLAKRYDVPELGLLKNFWSVTRHVAPSCGIKRGFSFANHREGEEQRGEECSQFPTWGPPFGPDMHFFRQDIDAWLLALAVRYGADLRQRVSLAGFEQKNDCVELRTTAGETIRAAFLVDGTGFESPIAKGLGLRVDPCPLETRSRTIFTHMVGVPPYESVSDGQKHGLAYRYSQTTLHHVIPGGWYWIIPFDNHPGATNPLCSVGLSLNLDRWPVREDISPEDEFRAITRRFPSVEKQLGGARAVREWVRTPRLQFFSRGTRSDRVLLLSHAAGFVDALYSGGLAQTIANVNNLGWRLVEAARAKDFSSERFAFVEEWSLRGIRHHDRLVSRSYQAFGDWELFDAWNRVWMMGSTFGATGHVAIGARFDRSGDRTLYDEFERAPHRGHQSSDIPEFMALFDAAAAEMDRARAGAISSSEAARRVLAHVGSSPLTPRPWNLGDPTVRCPTTFTLPRLAELAAWGWLRGPESVRKNFDLRGRVGRTLGAVATSAAWEALRGARTMADVVRDALTSK